jgi:hypothetical protein
MAMTSVWVKLYYECNDEAIGDAVKIEPIPEDMNDLKKAAFPDIRSPVQIASVKVYGPGTDIPVRDSTSHLLPGETVSDSTRPIQQLIKSLSS